MSANIIINKIKFSVFGRGYDDDRGNSGTGEIIKVNNLRFNAISGAFDDTGNYCWIMNASTYDSYLSYGVHKLDVSNDWAEVSQSIIPENVEVIVCHPSNVVNNIGLVFANNGNGSDVILFDLTDDTVINSGTYEEMPVVLQDKGPYEVQMVGDYIYVMNKNNGVLYALYTTDMSISKYTTGDALRGFINNSTIYAYHGITWFSDYLRLYKLGMDLSQIWEIMAPTSGSDGFPNVEIDGFAGNGYIYLPAKVNGKWRIGQFKTNSSTDFVTPRPARTFGDFEDRPVLYRSVMFSDGKTRATLFTNLGVYVTDFDSVVYVCPNSDFHLYGHGTPICMNEKYILALIDGMSGMRLYEYG